MKILVIPLLIVCSLGSLAWGQHRPPAGGGQGLDRNSLGPCISPAERQQIWERVQEIRKNLVHKGALKQPTLSTAPLLAFPLRQRDNPHYPGYYGMSNYVDHDNSTGLQEFTCGDRTYDGHRGIDYFLWPFPWDMMAREEVEIVAAATGVIMSKIDNNVDQNCSWEGAGSWNAVYIEHGDGSIAWYGHMKRNTLTEKAVGDTVFAGEYLGLVGSSGRSSGPHLHLELFSPDGSTYDPFVGSCNPTTSTSGWKEQAPYIQPALNFVMTGDGAPDLQDECPEDEIIHASTQFASGQRIYFSAYFVDQAVSQSAHYRVIQPNGQLLYNWTHNPPQRYHSSWWYWWETLPAESPSGTWTYEVIFEGDTLSTTFDVDIVSSISSIEAFATLNPNPFVDAIQLSGDLKTDLQVVVKDMHGKQVFQTLLRVENSSVDLAFLSRGLYFVEVQDLVKGRRIVKKMVKK